MRQGGPPGPQGSAANTQRRLQEKISAGTGSRAGPQWRTVARCDEERWNDQVGRRPRRRLERLV